MLVGVSLYLVILGYSIKCIKILILFRVVILLKSDVFGGDWDFLDCYVWDFLVYWVIFWIENYMVFLNYLEKKEY